MKIPENEFSELVLAYINGDDTSYELDDLENNAEFMMRVILKTNDKNSYNCCSEKLKTDSNFIKFLISKFHDDLEYVDKIVNYFISASNDAGLNLDLLIFLANFEDKRISLKYMEKVNNYVSLEIRNINEFLKNQPNEEVQTDLGFGMIIEEYKTSKIAINRFVRVFLANIFGNDEEFEKLLHIIFKSSTELKNYGISNFILDFIRIQDQDLVNYIENDISLIGGLISRSIASLDRWDEVSNKIISDNVNFVTEEAKKYYYQSVFDFDVPIDEAIYYVALAKNLDKYFSKCDISSMNDKPLSAGDLKLFKYIESLMDKTFNSNIKTQFNDYYSKEISVDNGIFEYPVSVERK